MSDVDVLVIGSGAAGLCAALTASEAGASVLVAESETVVGGSSRLSGGVVMGSGSSLQRAAGILDDPDAMYREYMALNQWQVVPGPVRRLATESGATIDWLAAHGVPFEDRLIFGGDESQPRSHVVTGRGQAIVDTLHRCCRERGVDVALGRRIDRLLVANGRIVGAGTGTDALRASAVALATGGFGANPEAILPGWLVIVDGTGQRIIDESAPYGLVDAMLRRVGDVAYVIFDDAAIHPPPDRADFYRTRYKQAWPGMPPFQPRNWRADVVDRMVTEGRISCRSTVGGVADDLGIDACALAGTIARYNGFAAAGEDRDFAKNGSFLAALDAPPFYGGVVRPTVVNVTAAGLRIDADAADTLHRLVRRLVPRQGLAERRPAVGRIPQAVGHLGRGRPLLHARALPRPLGPTTRRRRRRSGRTRRMDVTGPCRATAPWAALGRPHRRLGNRMSHGFIARFVVHEGQRDEALRVLDAMIAQVAAEPDTLVHQVLTDRDEPNVIWCYGRYTDEAGLKAHQASAVHDAIVPQLRALLTSDTRIHWADARNESLRHSEKMMETIGWSLTVESVPG